MFIFIAFLTGVWVTIITQETFQIYQSQKINKPKNITFKIFE